MDAIAAMGGPVRARRDAVPALAEGIEVIRVLWRSGETAHAGGDHFRADRKQTGLRRRTLSGFGSAPLAREPSS